MDFTEDYVIMCHKSKLKENRKYNYQVGDYMFHKNGWVVLIWLVEKHKFKWKLIEKLSNSIGVNCSTWLPTQSQLQDMIVDKYHSICNLLCNFGGWLNDELEFNTHNYWDDLSTEKLWLIYIMEYKFKKTWDFDKKEWIKI